jgi:hypothetical protein
MNDSAARHCSWPGTEENADFPRCPTLRAYGERLGVKWKSFRKGVIEEPDEKGYSRIVATVRISEDGEVSCDDEAFLPTQDELSAIRAEIATANLPKSIPATCLQSLCDELGLKSDDPSLFLFWNTSGKELLLVRQRIERGLGKVIQPWSWWSDAKWRPIEPDGDVPLFGLGEVSKFYRIMLHEGESAARWCQMMRDGATTDAQDAFKALPSSFQEAIKHAAHLGWCTGARNPAKTDWAPITKLAKDRRLVLVCDNDAPGMAAASKRLLKRPMQALMFRDGRFPPTFDLGDPFPDVMFPRTDLR